jgi:signal transduction histidine kinase
MHVDDRLATVLSASVTGDTAATTQYRQLIDLLGRLPANAAGRMVEEGFERLAALSTQLTAERRVAVLRDPALRQCNPRLVALLAEEEPEVASAAIAATRLDDIQWQALIPRLPVRARGFLRHRKDLGEGTVELLARLGVRDLVLTAPVIAEESEPLDLALCAQEATPAPQFPVEPPGQAAPAKAEPDEIAALLRRIEAFQKSRGKGLSPLKAEAPPLPMAELQDGLAVSLPRAFDFSTDAAGRVAWADPAAAPMIIGAQIADDVTGAPVRADAATLARIRRRLPITAGKITIEGAPAISGAWQMDATPRFAPAGGRFIGYCGRLRRPPAPVAIARDAQSERIRELLHELRTPVNAIQGFAEIIQQQLFGPSPHEYRALAASIAADAAKLLAGFDELDRLAKLESGALELAEDGCDFAAMLRATADQLEPFLRSRSAGLLIEAMEHAPAVTLGGEDAARLAWRLLATLAAATTPGEDLAISVDTQDGRLRVNFELPISYIDRDNIFTAAAQASPQALSAGMFGSGFSLRLARAEARAAGGDLVHEGENLALTLKLYKAASASKGERGPDASGEVQTA